MAKFNIKFDENGDLDFQSRGPHIDRVDLLLTAMTSNKVFLRDIVVAVRDMQDCVAVENTPELDALCKAANAYRKTL